jgi:hypothetical protein
LRLSPCLQRPSKTEAVLAPMHSNPGNAIGLRTSLPRRTFALWKSIKKRPSVTLAWMNSRSGKPKGRGAAITRKWAVQLSRYTRIAPPATACFMHIFWTESQYRVCLPLSIGSIGYHFSSSPLNLYGNSVYYPVDNSIFRTYDTQYSSFRSHCCTVFCRARSQAPGPQVPSWMQRFPRRISQPHGMIRS